MNKTTLIALFSALLLLTGCAAAPADTSADSSTDPESSLMDTSEAPPIQEETMDTAPEMEEPEELLTPMLTAEEIAALTPGDILTETELANQPAEDFFYAVEIPDAVFARMEGVSFGADCTTRRSDLRYVRLLHTGFDGETHVGELVVNKEITSDVLEIFEELYKNEYPIEKILLVDEYDGDDEASMADNNTSCFNFRTVSGSATVSRHGLGMALDINPLYNPYVTDHGIEPANAGDYTDRSKDTPYKIDSNDLCYRLFEEHGFAWGGWWNRVKDYQHFEK